MSSAQYANMSESRIVDLLENIKYKFSTLRNPAQDYSNPGNNVLIYLSTLKMVESFSSVEVIAKAGFDGIINPIDLEIFESHLTDGLSYDINRVAFAKNVMPYDYGKVSFTKGGTRRLKMHTQEKGFQPHFDYKE
jgi:hypothetical protein